MRKFLIVMFTIVTLVTLFIFQVAIAWGCEPTPTKTPKPTHDPCAVNISYFNAFYLGNAVKLEWESANEIGVSAYEIRKVTYTGALEVVARISAKNSGQLVPTTYSFLDTGIPGLHYYLLNIYGNSPTDSTTAVLYPHRVLIPLALQ